MSRSLLLCVALLAVSLTAQQPGEPSLQFVHLTDPHVVDLQHVAPELALQRDHFRNSGSHLGNLLAVLSDASAGPYRPAFFLITGDLIDAFGFAGEGGHVVDGPVAAFPAATAKSGVPVYLGWLVPLMASRNDGHHPAPCRGTRVAPAAASWASIRSASATSRPVPVMGSIGYG
jgi:hypothetical protein